MPTRADYEAAAGYFDDAATHMAALTSGAQAAQASRILRGGSLGRQVPERITSATASAAQCAQLIRVSADLCRQRALLIAEYETHLHAYDRAFYRYERYLADWRVRYNAWFVDETGELEHPGTRPLPPVAPTPPPPWAAVRRP